eukprot:scaffold11971_cov20-Tisochrysis_lutea.AAC.6
MLLHNAAGTQHQVRPLPMPVEDLECSIYIFIVAGTQHQGRPPIVAGTQDPMRPKLTLIASRTQLFGVPLLTERTYTMHGGDALLAALFMQLPMSPVGPADQSHSSRPNNHFSLCMGTCTCSYALKVHAQCSYTYGCPTRALLLPKAHSFPSLS